MSTNNNYSHASCVFPSLHFPKLMKDATSFVLQKNPRVTSKHSKWRIKYKGEYR